MKLEITKNYNEDGVNTKMVATFSIHDDCHNGIQSFSITSLIYQKGKCIGGGCNHEEIVKRIPEWKPFIGLHLTNEFGQPSHIDNIRYHINEKRLSTQQIADLYNLELRHVVYLRQYACNKDVFAYYLINSDIIDRWKWLADRGIRYLEEKTGHRFVHTENPNRCFYVAKDETWLSATKERVEKGDLTTEALEKEAKREREEWNCKMLAEIDETRKFYNKASDAYVWLVINCPTKNFRFFNYRPTNLIEVTLNPYPWQQEDMMDEETIAEFTAREDWPEGLTWKIKE